jgi:hypothetical protein
VKTGAIPIKAIIVFFSIMISAGFFGCDSNSTADGDSGDQVDADDDNELDDDQSEADDDEGDDDAEMEFSYSFGVHPSSGNDYAYAFDLGINFNREGVYLIWDWVDIDRSGSFKFKDATAPTSPDHPGGPVNYDSERKRLLDVDGIALMNNVCPFRGGQYLPAQFQNEQEKSIYRQFVEKMVERYDGDADLGCTQTNGIDCYNPGDNEYPIQDVITVLENNPIEYWQVCNQVTDVCEGSQCMENNLYAQKYAEVMELTYTAIKTACPDCRILIAGDSGKDMYPPVYEFLAGQYVDIVDKHFFGQAQDYQKIPEELDFLTNSLASSGFDLENLRIWITEVGTYSGDPVDDSVDPPEAGLPFQSEQQQAQSLVKRYAVSFGYGVEKVLWAWGLKEGFGCDCCIFDYTGLVYDGNIPAQACDSNLYDRGLGVKKLAYYSFKLMTQKLIGFSEVETLQNSEETYVYKFINNDRPIYIAWSEDNQSVVITGISGASVKITESTPAFQYGEEVDADQFDSAFNTEIKNANAGELTITLSETPVFVEMND